MKEKVLGHTAIGMGKIAIALGKKALGNKESKLIETLVEVSEEDDVKSKQRDYKKEAEKEKSNYRQFSVKIDRELGDQFSQWLSENNTSLADWFRSNAIHSIQLGIKIDPRTPR
jgi:hypothetical protein